MNKIAIHGFGRIGRSTLKAALRHKLFVPAVVCDIKDLPTLAALFAYDSNYGPYPDEVKNTATELVVGDDRITFKDTNDALPNWGELGVEVVIDCTGRATTRAGAEAHLALGAKRVLVSAASKTLQDCDAVLLPGINLEMYEPKEHRIISMASCTTNALAPVVKILRENFGIKTGFFSTVHAYTNTQTLTDQPMKDRRDSWAATENIIPSSSGAAKALKFIWPDLTISGKAYRVPVRTGSIAELNIILERATTTEGVRDVFRAASLTGALKGVLGVLEEEYASSRILGDPHSSVVDLPLVEVADGNFLTIAAWYDNEMGYSTRLAETAAYLLAR